MAHTCQEHYSFSHGIPLCLHTGKTTQGHSSSQRVAYCQNTWALNIVMGTLEIFTWRQEFPYYKMDMGHNFFYLKVTQDLSYLFLILHVYLWRWSRIYQTWELILTHDTCMKCWSYVSGHIIYAIFFKYDVILRASNSKYLSIHNPCLEWQFLNQDFRIVLVE